MTEINPLKTDARHFVTQARVARVVKPWITAIGITNTVALLSGIVYVVFVLPGAMAEKAMATYRDQTAAMTSALFGPAVDSIRDAGRVSDQVKDANSDMRDIRNDITSQESALKERGNQLSKVKDDIIDLDRTLAIVKADPKKIESVVAMLDRMKESKDGAELLNKLASIGIVIDSQYPSGTIVAFTGHTDPNPWLICDCRAFDDDSVFNRDGNIDARLSGAQGSGKFKKLRETLGNYWPTTKVNGTPVSKLPDLRGMFLRGANNARSDDWADTAERFPQAGGMGSVQHDSAVDARFNAFPIVAVADNQRVEFIASGYNFIVSGNIDTHLRGSVTHPFAPGPGDTRPQNVAVNWIIKY